MNRLVILFALVLIATACCRKPEEIILENIMTRTSVRQYTDQQLTEQQIETLLRAAMAAPSAVNKQPWAFLVIDDKEKLEAVGGIERSKNMIATAPVAILVCGDMSQALNGEAAEFWIQDASAATENLLLAAHGMGLGAVWTGFHPGTHRVDTLKQILNLPSHIEPLGVVPIGYPAESPTPKDKWSPEKVHRNVW